ncbi:MAG: AAA family ATPase [Rhodobacteraceae bacterium]|nr:AAA family ATPase [Paracoccaceae bacterium]
MSDSPLVFLSPDECAALPPREYVVKRLIAPGQIGCIFGPPGAGKSVLAPWLAYAVARGAEVFGLRTKSGDVLYVAAEDEDGMAGRIAALCACLGKAEGFRLVHGAHDLFSSGQSAGGCSPDLEALRQAVCQQRPSLLVIDTLAMAMPGLEENDAAGMNRVVQIGKSLARYGTAVIFVHHGTKAEGTTPRGHSVFNGALDFSIVVAPANQARVVRGVVRKNRNGPPNLNMAFCIGSRHVGKDIDGEPIYAPICEPCEPLAVDEARSLPGAAKAALAQLNKLGNGDWVAETEWRNACTTDRLVSPSENLKSRQTAFRRQVTILLERKQIEFSEEKYRPTNPNKAVSAVRD